MISSDQIGRIVIIFILAITFAIVIIFVPQENKRKPLELCMLIFGYSLLGMALGFILASISGKNFMDVIKLVDPGGFGRMYTFGLAFFIAGMIFGIKNIVVWILKSLK